ncbi:glutaredoxin family protein [Propionibacteriaceae bacterium Y1685]|uniref:glutaredoxin family protein n=1 Tax=Microlunatus sp. Y1700 TaxID=3418487 RepID=UPI003B7F01C9
MSQSPSNPRVRVYVRQNCHLCEVALETIARLTTEAHTSYETVDIDADPALRAQWTDQVPVTFVDGVQHDFWRVDENRLRAALAAPGARS